MSRIRQLQISVTSNFFIFHITGRFWDCWKVSLSLFSSFFLYLFIFVRLFVRSFFSPSFFLLWRERDFPWARDNRCMWHGRRTFVVIYYSCNLETVGPGLTHSVYHCGWSACTKWCSFISQQFLIRWMNKLCAQPSGMINCRGGKNDTLLRDFVCHWIRGVVPGIARINRWDI